ncbi:MAG TPA: hypothetical protein DCM50_10270 [Stenotrophomonas sp.]|nr:hypothetical protein [Stenotrophomonas sp.]
MPDWNALDDAYGSAETVGAMLEELGAGSGEVDWEVLWSHLCHQSTVYSASLQALPYLLRAALKAVPAQRIEPLVLAGAIVSHADGVPVQVPGHPQLLSLLQDCTAQTLRELARDDLSEASFLHLLQARLAFGGERVWSRALAGVLEGELSGVCPACQVDLYIGIDPPQAFVTHQEWIGGGAVRTAAIEAGAGDPASESERWLLEMARAHRAGFIATLALLLGTSRCTRCETAFELREAVRLTD